MRVNMSLGMLLIGLLASSSAFAQGDYVHHKWCLRTGGGGEECAYQTLAQCKAAKSGDDQSCFRNTAPTHH
jgi:Protein of unknown function (DUF3551)